MTKNKVIRKFGWINRNSFGKRSFRDFVLEMCSDEFFLKHALH